METFLLVAPYVVAIVGVGFFSRVVWKLLEEGEGDE